MSRDPDPFPRLRWRRRLLVVALAVATAVAVVTTLLAPPGGVDRSQRVPRADAQRCAPGQTRGCVGGTAAVIVPATAASAPR